MEKIMYVGPRADFAAGAFGTLTQCALFVLQREGHSDLPDNDDPWGHLAEQMGGDPDVYYQLEAAETAIPSLLTVAEARRLVSLPPFIEEADIPAWLASAHDAGTLRDMADVLHGRFSTVHIRGVYHRVGQSPFTPELYDQLRAQLSD